MESNEHQLRLWRGMLKFIEAFRKGELSYYDLVGNLEGALDAGEFKNREMIEQWYDYWGPLEIWNATKGNIVTIEDVNQDLSEMELFLSRTLLKKNDVLRLYWLLDEYSMCKLNIEEFCDEFFNVYNLAVDVNDLTDIEKEVFDRINEIIANYLECREKKVSSLECLWIDKLSQQVIISKSLLREQVIYE